MARGIYVFIISLIFLTGARLTAQDTVMVPLHIRAGFDAGNFAGNFINKNQVSFGVKGSVDINEKTTLSGIARYSSFSSNKDSYDYSSKGLSFTAGPEFNFLKPQKAEGKYFIGAGINYGLSFYSHETSRLEYSNPWGTSYSAIPSSKHVGQFIEIVPGVQTRLFSWMTIGWNVSLRMLLSDGTKGDLKPVYMPGFGNATSRTSFGASYYISFSIPYRTKRLIIKPKAESDEEPEESPQDNTDVNQNTNSFNNNY